MKKRYKKYMSLYRKDIKNNLSRLKELNSIFLWSDNNIQEFDLIYTQLKNYYRMFNYNIHTNISFVQFIKMF